MKLLEHQQPKHACMWHHCLSTINSIVEEMNHQSSSRIDERR
jgi:hypothetical protein